MRRSSREIGLRAKAAIGERLGCFYNQCATEENMVRSAADHYVHCSRRHSPMHIAIEQHQIDRTDGQRDRLGLAGIESHSFKTSELPHRK